MTIAMIIFSFFSGATIATIAMHLYHNELHRQRKADTIVALAQQAEDSYRAGYMRCESNYAAKRKRPKMSADTTVLIPTVY